MTAALTVENIEVVYNHSVQALRGLSIEVPNGQIVALLGSNGAGKTTTLKAASGVLPYENGRLASGRSAGGREAAPCGGRPGSGCGAPTPDAPARRACSSPWPMSAASAR